MTGLVTACADHTHAMTDTKWIAIGTVLAAAAIFYTWMAYTWWKDRDRR